jgi:peptide deformylase
MPDDISQAAPAEPVTPQATIVPEPTQQPSAQPEQQTEKPLTLEDYKKIARDEALKIAQSQVAKGENRIQKFIKDKFDALEQTKGALGLSDEQVAQARQKIVADAYSSKEEPAQPAAPTEPQAGSDVDEAISYMNAQIQATFGEVGTTVTKDDPEFKELQDKVNAAWNDPNGLAKILLAAQKAATTKAARLQAQQQTVAARVIGGGGGGTTNLTSNLTPEQKISQGIQNVQWQQGQTPPSK